MAIMPPRPVFSPDDAEVFVAQWLRFAGYRDAERTPRGADKGIDVRASGVVAQVKFFRSSPVGRPAMQQLHGAAALGARQALFFSSSGYTKPAREYAEAMGIALFIFTSEGAVSTVNREAETISRAAQGLGPPVSESTAAGIDSIAKVLGALVGIGVLVLGFKFLMGIDLIGSLIGAPLLPLISIGVGLTVQSVVSSSLLAREQRRLDLLHGGVEPPPPPFSA